MLWLLSCSMRSILSKFRSFQIEVMVGKVPACDYYTPFPGQASPQFFQHLNIEVKKLDGYPAALGSNLTAWKTTPPKKPRKIVSKHKYVQQNRSVVNLPLLIQSFHWLDRNQAASNNPSEFDQQTKNNLRQERKKNSTWPHSIFFHKRTKK